MQRRSNINLNSAGKVSCLLLLLITILGISPVTSATTYAEEMDGEEQLVADQSDEVAASTDTPSTTALTNSSYQTSSITIGFVPTKAETSLSPIDAAGAKGKINVKVNINLQNSDGYKIYVGSDSDQLKNGDDTIDPLTSEVDYNNIPVNHWGFSIQEGETAKDSYKAMPTNLRGTPEITSKEDEKNIKNKDLTYTLSFAANIDATKPAGTYSNEVTVSVVSSPRQLTLSEITNMQDMTSGVCEASANDEVAQLKDVRDGKYYWVGKMPDKRCWMTQNLDLDLTTDDTKLTDKNTNLTTVTKWAPNVATSTTATYEDDDDRQASWSMSGVLGDVDYYTVNPDSTTSCGSQIQDITKCSAENVGEWTLSSVPKSANGDTNAHRLLGNLYSWGAATAGATTDEYKNAGDNAKNSICSYGWRLPTSGDGGEFQVLSNKLGATSGTATTGTVSKLTDAPFYAVRGGAVGNTTYLFLSAGNSGSYWSSTVSNDASAYRLYFFSISDITPSYSYNRRYGFSIRCINNPDI